MTADGETISIPFSLTDDDLREVRNRWLKRQVRTLPLVAIMLIGGAAMPGKLGGVFLGAGLYLVVLVAVMYRRVYGTMRTVFGGEFAERRLVLSAGRAGLHSAAGLSWLNATTVKKVVEGNRLTYFDTPWDQWHPVPMRVTHQPDVWARLVEATARPQPVPENIDRWR